jgi:hypothetical protein
MSGEPYVIFSESDGGGNRDELDPQFRLAIRDERNGVEKIARQQI